MTLASQSNQHKKHIHVGGLYLNRNKLDLILLNSKVNIIRTPVQLMLEVRIRTENIEFTQTTFEIETKELPVQFISFDSSAERCLSVLPIGIPFLNPKTSNKTTQSCPSKSIGLFERVRSFPFQYCKSHSENKIKIFKKPQGQKQS
jgi:hypothetical protein